MVHSKTYSTFPRGIERKKLLPWSSERRRVRPIRHSHGELKDAVVQYMIVERFYQSKTYSTFPRGIESPYFFPPLVFYYLAGKTYSTFPRGIESLLRRLNCDFLYADK